MPKTHIDKVYPKSDVHPMILNFQNGYATEQFEVDKCNLFSNEKNGLKCVTAELNDMLYAGEEEKEDLGKTFILAKNRVTGKVRLIEVGSALLKPILKVDNDTPQVLETSHLELSRKFGSKKQKQQMEQREKLKVNVETVTEQMQNVTQAISEDKLDLSSYNKSDSDDFYIPPIDRTADKPENVYDIDKILTEDQYEKIYSELEEKDYAAEYTPFIKSIATGKKLSNRQTVLAVYANSLLKYSVTMAKEVSKKNFVACTHSPTLNNIIQANFSVMTNGKRTRPTPYKDKALCHAIVFALLINNLKFNLEMLCEDAKITAATAAMKIRVTGASVVSLGSKKAVQLKLPLNTKSGFRRRSARF
ncbi:DNA-directed RNA polymerase I subunit RPA49-like [Pectinophora gossypiella]|nr:DNA-directed RNA polymerase I subunit RPA49-like [Pectinophora gossypiella]